MTTTGGHREQTAHRTWQARRARATGLTNIRVLKDNGDGTAIYVFDLLR